MFIKPSRPKYDPKDDLTQEGSFLCICTGTHDCDPDPKYPGSKDRLAIEFTVYAPGQAGLHGKKTALVVTQSIYKDPKTGQESNLLKIGRMMGIVNPEKGFDPDVFLDKYYMVHCVRGTNGKIYPKTLMPHGQPANASGKAPTKMDTTIHQPPEIESQEEIPF